MPTVGRCLRRRQQQQQQSRRRLQCQIWFHPTHRFGQIVSGGCRGGKFGGGHPGSRPSTVVVGWAIGHRHRGGTLGTI
eukprot:scaffold40816_cov168-Amphora_coffeaeformis.AAC.3